MYHSLTLVVRFIGQATCDVLRDHLGETTGRAAILEGDVALIDERRRRWPLE
jgi:hypothetical protein